VFISPVTKNSGVSTKKGREKRVQMDTMKKLVQDYFGRMGVSGGMEEYEADLSDFRSGRKPFPTSKYPEELWPPSLRKESG